MLEFRTDTLFNSKRLQQYDEEGQKHFLGYILRVEEWNIKDNKITFPNITDENKVEKLIKNNELELKAINLSIKKSALETIFVVGHLKYQDMLDEERKQIEKENKGIDKNQRER